MYQLQTLVPQRARVYSLPCEVSRIRTSSVINGICLKLREEMQIQQVLGKHKPLVAFRGKTGHPSSKRKRKSSL